MAHHLGAPAGNAERRWVRSLSPERALPSRSGEKYKRCCFTKSFHYYVDAVTGDVYRSMPLKNEDRAELDKALASQREKFIAKFGREPGPDDPIFFDLDEDAVRKSTTRVGHRHRPESRRAQPPAHGPAAHAVASGPRALSATRRAVDRRAR